MTALSNYLSDEDLGVLVDILSPGHAEKRRMIRTMRADEDILHAMVSDPKVFEHLTAHQESFVRVSPLLFFTVLLMKVKNDLKSRPYTVEMESRRRMFVFDSGEVADLLEEEAVLPYLSHMLASFVKINSFSVMTQVRRGVWNRFRFSDFDVEGLVRYSRTVDEEQRFVPYKRIADICLFVCGVFPDYVAANELNRGRRARGLEGFGREEFSSRGAHYYRAAALHHAALFQGMREVLLRLSEEFDLAVKPLSHLSTHYLGLLKDRLFLQ